MKYIKKIAERESWNAGYIQLWDFSRANLNKESRIEAVATVASICYGKQAKDAKKLIERLWTESRGLPSSAFEFVRDGRASEITQSMRNDHHLAAYEDDNGFDGENLAKWHKENIATFRLKIPIFLARQVMRHRQFSYQELSRRYVDDTRVPLTFWVPEEEEVGPVAMSLFQLVYTMEEEAYKRLLGANVRPEIARTVLGTGLFTEFWMMGNRSAWENYFKLRLDQHTQKAHQRLAQIMLGLLERYQSEFKLDNGVGELTKQ